MTAVNMPWLVCLLLSAPLLLGIAILIVPAAGWGLRLISGLHIASGAIVLAVSGIAVALVSSGPPLWAFDGWFLIDPLAGVFLILIAALGFLVGCYSVPFLNTQLADNVIGPRDYRAFFGLSNIFLFTMLLSLVSNNIVVMWVAIEASTLSSAFLVAAYRKRVSLEAAWKYLILCSVGVAFGLYGTVLTFSNATDSLLTPEQAVLWSTIAEHASALDPVLAKISFAFILIGFGTKAGIFPMHAWMPDGYAEAPAPASAPLAGALINCPLFVIIRYYTITSMTAGAGFLYLALIVMGMLSIGYGAFLFYGQHDLKRKLAYSSVENVGVILVGLGFGGPLGVGAALLHVLNHGLAKALIFCCAGNVILKYRTRDLTAIRGILSVSPATSVFMIVASLSLSGAPPFGAFISEFMTVSAGFTARHSLITVLVTGFLVVVLAGFIKIITGSILGPPPEGSEAGAAGPGRLAFLPMGVLALLLLALGVTPPAFVRHLVMDAVAEVTHNGAAATRVLISPKAAHPASRPQEQSI